MKIDGICVHEIARAASDESQLFAIGSYSQYTNREAKVRYEVMNTLPENWIPFIPVHVPADNREIQLQRASLPRRIEK